MPPAILPCTPTWLGSYENATVWRRAVCREMRSTLLRLIILVLPVGSNAADSFTAETTTLTPLPTAPIDGKPTFSDEFDNRLISLGHRR